MSRDERRGPRLRVYLSWTRKKCSSRRRANANREPDHKERYLLMAEQNPTVLCATVTHPSTLSALAEARYG
jgi:hypothetical protein